MTDNEKRTHNEQVVRDFLRLLEAMDIDAWADLWAENGVQEMPYSPAGFPLRVEGRAALHRHYSGLPTNFTRMAFPDLVVYPTLDPDVFWTEYRGEIDIAATGRPYNNRYAGLFRLRDGKIVLFREYFNPNVLSESFGDPSSLARNFNINK